MIAFNRNPGEPDQTKYLHNGDMIYIVGTFTNQAKIVVVPEPPSRAVALIKQWSEKVPPFTWDLVAAALIAIAAKIGHYIYKNPSHLKHLIEEDDDEEEDDDDDDDEETEKSQDPTPSKAPESDIPPWKRSIAGTKAECDEWIRTHPEQPKPVAKERLIDRVSAETLLKKLEGEVIDKAESELRRILDTPIGKQ